MIDLSHMRGRPVAVLGLGKTGLPTVEALLASGAAVTAWDDNPGSVEAARSAGAMVQDLAQGVPQGSETLVLSPGIPHTFPKPHHAVSRAKEAGLRIVSDIELLIGADPQACYIGITGTNGKSTTTALLYHVLASAGHRAQVGGNLGPAALSLEKMGAGGTYVLELSSYQLELTPSLVPDIAVLLNITPDHLDRHGGMDGYVAAKRSLFRADGKRQTAIIGIDDAPSHGIAAELKTLAHFEVVTLSMRDEQATITFRDGQLRDSRSGESFDLTGYAALPGSHNWQNAAAVYAAARAAGVPSADILAAFASFPGLEHRQQRVAVIDGIAYINDSKATNADATAKALACYDNIYWIAGGLSKEGGLDGLQPLMHRVTHAFLIGKAEEEFATWMDGRLAYDRCTTLDRAVAAAAQMAASDNRPGAVVLLSPACASWDQFDSFEHRGRSFAELVRSLPNASVAA